MTNRIVMQVHLIFKNHKKQTSRFQTNGEGVRKKNLKKKKKQKIPVAKPWTKSRQPYLYPPPQIKLKHKNILDQIELY